MAMYQFLIATQQIKGGWTITELKDPQGNLTGHLLGLYNRSIMLMDHGIKPIWVFDGKPPEAKINVLKGRKERKEEAKRNEENAKDQGDMEKALKFANQTVKITQVMTDDAKKLISLMGLPVVEATSEAEASCSILAKTGKANVAATEDMDSLCFGCPTLIRDLTSKDEEITEISLKDVLEGLELTMDEFIDVCILCGCDYCSKIEGIGPVNAYKLIKDYKDIEGVIKYAENYNKDPSHKKKLIYDLSTFTYEEARKLFKEPSVVDPNSFTFNWTKAKEEELKQFMVVEKGFDGKRIDTLISKISQAKSKSNQTRMDNFFQLKPINSSSQSGLKLSKPLTEKKRNKIKNEKMTTKKCKTKK
jgi:flap endonuclease-1